MRRALAEAAETAADDSDVEFGEMLAAEADRLAGYARRLAGSGADADDLLQDTMLRCWAARGSFRPGSNFRGWTRVVMRNGFLSGRRRVRFHAELPEDVLETMLSVAPNQTGAMDLRDVDWAIGELTPEHRAALLLASDGVTVEEAAARLSISPNTFKSRVSRARARLRRLIQDGDALRRSNEPPRTITEPSRPRRRAWKGVIIG